MRRHEGQHGDDHDHADDVPPHADVGEQGDDPDPEGVQQSVDDQDRGKEVDRVTVRERPSRRDVEQEVEEESEAEVDAGGDGHLAQEIEPAGEPGPHRTAVALGQLGRPVVQAAGGRVRRTDLGHAQPHHEGHTSDEDPAPDHLDRSAGVHPEGVQRQTSRQDRDDGEGHGEVGEAAHPSPELLRVTEPVQLGNVALDRSRAHESSPCCPRKAGSPALCSPSRSDQESTPMSSICGGRRHEFPAWPRIPPVRAAWGREKRHRERVPLITGLMFWHYQRTR